MVKFIELANIKHNYQYDYSLVSYSNSKTPIKIVCPIHGEFWQRPNQHLQGHGCPICNQSQLEKEVACFLNEQNILYVPQCMHRTFEWLKRQSLDFYLPQYNIAIECQGEQHYKPISYNWGKDKNSIEEQFRKIQERDQRKARLCKENGVRLLYYTHSNQVEESETTFKDKTKLLQTIVNSNISPS